MVLSEISIGAAVWLLILTVLAVGLMVMTDRQMMRRAIRVVLMAAVQIGVVAVAAWLVWRADAWWANGLWLMGMLTMTSAWCVYEMRTSWRKVVVPVVVALAAAMMVGGGSLTLCLPGRVMVPVMGVVIGQVALTLVQTLCTYERSMAHTLAHRQYLLANGATRQESLMPSMRRAMKAALFAQIKTMAQPLVVTMPLLFAGLLLGGIGPVAALAVVIVMGMGTFVATVVAALVAIICSARMS